MPRRRTDHGRGSAPAASRVKAGVAIKGRLWLEKEGFRIAALLKKPDQGKVLYFAGRADPGTVTAARGVGLEEAG